MRISLGILALGTLTSWLLAGGLGSMLAETLPFHQIEGDSRRFSIASQIFQAPATWVALAVILLGGALWFGRSMLASRARVFEPILAA